MLLHHCAQYVKGVRQLVKGKTLAPRRGCRCAKRSHVRSKEDLVVSLLFGWSHAGLPPLFKCPWRLTVAIRAPAGSARSMTDPLALPVPAPSGSGLEAAQAVRAGQTLGDGRKVSPSDIQLVQNLIERCLQAYMPKLEVVKTLQEQYNIEPRFTTLVWQQLERENPEFFWAYYLRLKLKDQIVLFNHLLVQQHQMVQKLQQRFIPPMVPRPAAEFSGVSPFGTVQMPTNQHLQAGAQTQRQPGAVVQANGLCSHSSLPGRLAPSPDGVVACSEPAQQGPLANPLMGSGLVPVSSPTPPAPSALPGMDLQGMYGMGPLALSSPLDLEFNSNLLPTCSSPDLALPGTTADFMLSERGMPGIGTGSANDLQGMAQAFSYPDLASLDIQVPPYMNTEGDGLTGAIMSDLPRISSLSDMTPLDLEALDRS
ncbi:unnamed protein product [Ostreobium quekettii]|uniref:Uncharacterized protein n=1 Tax=Ostreobium quekettii TaxID=121088 RepID=A0A8S1J0E6_9CHLO|nr:unnamed protein product [Ostreobium quekettii]|eukprot:evm.model.scf_204.10 EVM.evm.TU.scf_204.10   scf_204:46741-48015(+)